MARRLSEAPPPDGQRWLWQNHLALGYMTIIDGVSGSGKTMVAFDLIARPTAGSRWPDGTPVGQPADVLIVTVTWTGTPSRHASSRRGRIWTG